MILSTNIPGSQLALHLLLILPCLFYVLSPLLTAVFGSDAYFAHLDFVDEVAVLDSRTKILELEIQKATLRMQSLQFELQKANLTAMIEVQKSKDEKDVMMEKAKLEVQKSADNERMMMGVMTEKMRLEEANKKLFFANLHSEQEDKNKLERYREYRMLLETMAQKKN